MSLNQSLSVLVIDDSATARISTVNLIKDQPIKVFSAEDGIDAFSQLSTHKPSLILLDLSMPILDGVSVLSILKSNAEFSDIPIVILSGKDGLCDKAQAINLGASDFLLKPCSKESLLAIIGKLF